VRVRVPGPTLLHNISLDSKKKTNQRWTTALTLSELQTVDGEGIVTATSRRRGPKLNTLIPFPATVKDLLEMHGRGEEYLIIGKHSFATVGLYTGVFCLFYSLTAPVQVCLVAKVAFLRSEQSAQYMTYGLVDTDDPEGGRSQRVVNVSRFMNEDEKTVSGSLSCL